jgi:5-methylcytosine-specific restriction endonuclease McrA
MYNNQQYLANLRIQRRNDGLCQLCGKPSRPGKTECYECRQRRIMQRDERKRRAVEYLGGQCVDCGLRTDVMAVYDFHHKDVTTKTSGIADFIKRKRPWETLGEDAGRT